tara:strand:- start:149 stop:727 length:579 start_codon:yes stop_codon:yes gene_type:complete
MILLIDNYDSFTYNLVHYVSELGTEVIVRRNDKITVQQALDLNPSGILLSPGPCDPDKAGICLDLVGAVSLSKIPLLGVCLGHQTIGQYFGGKIIKCHEVVHGKMGVIRHENSQLFKGLPSPIEATRYHSLIVERSTLPDELTVTAETEDGVIMGLSHKNLPIHGVQFHPESIASQYGHELLKNFINILKVK